MRTGAGLGWFQRPERAGGLPAGDLQHRPEDGGRGPAQGKGARPPYGPGGTEVGWFTAVFTLLKSIGLKV